MKRTTKLEMPALLALCTFLCLAACGDEVEGHETDAPGTGGRWQELSDYAVEQRELAEKKLQGALDELDRDVGELERRIDSAGAAAKQELSAALADLRAKRDELAADLAELRRSGADAWEANRDEILEGLESVQRGLSKAWEDLLR